MRRTADGAWLNKGLFLNRMLTDPRARPAPTPILERGNPPL
jgi:hypothetical protein